MPSPFFYIFAAMMLSGGLMVIFMRNPVSSALSMVLSFHWAGRHLHWPERLLCRHLTNPRLRRSDHGALYFHHHVTRCQR